MAKQAVWRILLISRVHYLKFIGAFSMTLTLPSLHLINFYLIIKP